MTAPATQSGSLRLGVSETIVHTWLTAFIDRMGADLSRRRHRPLGDISPRHAGGPATPDLDLAFLVGPVTTPRLVNVPLGTSPRPGSRHPASHRIRPGRPADLISTRSSPSRPTRTPYTQLRDLLAQADLPPLRLYTSASLSAIIRMAIEGTGIGAIPAEVVRSEVDRGSCGCSRPASPAGRHLRGRYENAPDQRLSAAATQIALEVAAEWTAINRQHGNP